MSKGSETLGLALCRIAETIAGIYVEDLTTAEKQIFTICQQLGLLKAEVDEDSTLVVRKT